MSIAVRIALTFLVGSLLFVGVPLLTWGVADLPGFFGHPVRLAYIVIVLVLNAFAAIRIPEVGKRRGTAKKVVRRQHWAVIVMQALTIAAVALAPWCDRRNIAVIGDAAALRVLGLGLYVAGFLIMHWAEAALGKQFSTEVAIQDGHNLVTDGPYRYIRHPRYLGIVIFFSGISLVFGSWLSLILGAAMLLVVLWRIHDEELLLREEFGKAWEAYARRSWSLIPYVV